ncbi:MAG TPA: glutamine--fructose-6-phosphate transaminase (isomerizing), partial [Chitinophagales bacterium]|nr:glutamine--fructose-6-phosphate transaminase (isomerizing) [Chitinophagales bacterium]
MCGIVAYLGHRDAYPVIIKGLHRLEYRGYDSAGIALLNGDMRIFKCAGKVSELEALAEGKNTGGTVGIGHTRWATHGEPNTRNAHPHVSNRQKLAIIHNGIIENYASLKTELLKRGHVFESDTDTEVLIHLIEDIEEKESVDLAEAVRIALTQVVGAYAIVIASEENPDLLIAARKSSPLVLGIGDNEYFVASDATPLIEYTKEVVYLNDEEIAIVERGKELVIKNLENEEATPYIQELQLQLDMIEKGGYDHYMLKEINEQPNSIKDSMRGRLGHGNRIQLGGIVEYENKIMHAKRIIIVACGTSWHAGLVAEYLFEDLARIPVEVEYASEFRYRNPVIGEDDVVIAISQSG